MSKLKAAVDFDKAAERPDRPKVTNRISTPYEIVEAHGVVNPGTTVPQFKRSHEQANDPEAISQGAILPGEDGVDNAKRRFLAIHKRRKETEAAFDENRKKSSSI